jgi:capsular polysaccharide biosynthesis protein
VKEVSDGNIIASAHKLGTQSPSAWTQRIIVRKEDRKTGTLVARSSSLLSRDTTSNPMPFIFSPPSLADVIRLLRAWRFWLLTALIGALIGAAIYFIVPPPYRARATINVDFNLEQAWPQETDREQFYYLERETRKLERVAWSDAVMQAVADADGAVTVSELRDGKLQLSQPAEAGWHFFADDEDAKRAEALASAWAQAFAKAAQANVSAQAGLNSFIKVEVTESANLPKQRSVPLSSYLLAGTVGAWFLGAFVFLFFDFGVKKKDER